MSVEIKGLCKAYGEKQVLRDLSHRFPEGKTTCIMGASGCGKTTLLRLLMGLELPDSGEIIGIKGKRLSAVFQEDRLCPSLSPTANLRLINPALSRQEAEKNLCALGLSGSLRQPVRELSGGMKRRVAILRALSAEYDLLLADEPFQGLDKDTKRQVMEYFREKTLGKTVLLVTHQEQEAEFLGQELLRL